MSTGSADGAVSRAPWAPRLSGAGERGLADGCGVGDRAGARSQVRASAGGTVPRGPHVEGRLWPLREAAACQHGVAGRVQTNGISWESGRGLSSDPAPRPASSLHPGNGRTGGSSVPTSQGGGQELRLRAGVNSTVCVSRFQFLIFSLLYLYTVRADFFNAGIKKYIYIYIYWCL